MTDTLHDKLWRTMQAHGVGWIDNGTPDAHCYCGHRPARLGASWHAHVADAILTIPGITIMELPEPDYGPDGEGQFGWSANGTDITATPDLDGHWSVWDSDCQLEPHDARDLAAALLAAAEYAERER